MQLQADAITIVGGGCDTVRFERLNATPSVRRGVLSSTLVLPVEGLKPIRLRAVDLSTAQAFAAAVEVAWRAYNLAKLNEKAVQIDGLLSVIAGLQKPLHYPAACLLSDAQERAEDLHRSVLSRLPPNALDPQQADHLAPISRFATEPQVMRDAAIDHFVEAELAHWKDFFDTIEAMPLTAEQRLSVVVDEDATLVLAGAGSGKTSVITAKAAYLIKARIRKPEEILLLTFARDAANEMSERIEARCGKAVQARTFHALAYDSCTLPR